MSPHSLTGPDESRRFFNCRQCGDCCRGYGGTVVAPQDIEVIAEFVGLPLDRFKAQCCVTSGGRTFLAQQGNGYCAFWDRICTIHPVKPRMCREWPLIRSVLIDPGNWQVMAAMCPGINRDISGWQVQAYLRKSDAAGA